MQQGEKGREVSFICMKLHQLINEHCPCPTISLNQGQKGPGHFTLAAKKGEYKGGRNMYVN
jgi:hypothetical protein